MSTPPSSAVDRVQPYSAEPQKHPHCHIDPLARLSGDVRLGERARVGSCAVLEGPLTAGDDLYAHPGALIGGPAQHRHGGGDGALQLGHRVEIREAATIHRGTASSGGITTVGDDVLIMAYAHVGHDCALADGVTLCNGAQLGGHVEIRSNSMIGARAALHQFVRVGTGAMVAAGSMVSGNVPPWTLVAGDRARIVGPNSHALREHGLGSSRSLLRQALRMLWPASGQPGIDPDKITIALQDHGAEEDPVISDLVRFLLEPSRRSCCSRGRN